MRKLCGLGVLMMASVCLSGAALAADDVFAAVMASRARAEAVEAATLAPDSYAAALKALERARRAAGSGRTGAALQADIDRADELFRAAVTAAQVAQDRFAEVLREREAARSADAWRLVPERWLKAGQDLSAAGRRLEDGEPERATELAQVAAAGYREAQLQALRSRYLSPTRAMLIDAGRMKADRYAPLTLAEANAKLAAAEAALAGNRAQPERAAAEIEAARLAAVHALNVATLVNRVEAGEQSLEELVLGLEDSVRRMAEAAGQPTTSIAGNPEATGALIAALGELRARAENAERELGERDRQLRGMEDELRELDARLGGATTERDRLLMRQAAEQGLRDQISTIERQLSPDEARIIQSPGKLVLSLNGLSFPPGSAQLKRDATPLLRKAAQAIALFPRAGIVIEGHTDSAGDAESNQRLSEARAQAVRSWLMTELGLPPGRLQALGHGESRPVASNDSNAGRKQNRRIDIVIQTGSADGVLQGGA
jgi:outer membrane protein OmpA-like peptidoglycan-associated protein